MPLRTFKLFQYTLGLGNRGLVTRQFLIGGNEVTEMMLNVLSFLLIAFSFILMRIVSMLRLRKTAKKTVMAAFMSIVCLLALRLIALTFFSPGYLSHYSVPMRMVVTLILTMFTGLALMVFRQNWPKD